MAVCYYGCATTVLWVCCGCAVTVCCDCVPARVPFQVQAYTTRCLHGDRIEVGDRRFCGSAAPAVIEVSAGSNFTWRSDGSVGHTKKNKKLDTLLGTAAG